MVIDGDIYMEKKSQSHVIFSVKILKITVANKNVYIGFPIDIMDGIQYRIKSYIQGSLNFTASKI